MHTFIMFIEETIRKGWCTRNIERLHTTSTTTEELGGAWCTVGGVGGAGCAAAFFVRWYSSSYRSRLIYYSSCSACTVEVKQQMT